MTELVDVRLDDAYTFDFDGYFSPDYLRFFPAYRSESDSDADTERLVRALELAPPAKILDLGCGQGRITVRLAALGYDVLGVDCNATMLREAATVVDQAGVAARLLRKDMRALALGESFDAVVLWMDTFGYYDDETNGALLRRVRAHLGDGGGLVLEIANKDAVVRGLPEHDVVEHGDEAVIDTLRYDAMSCRVVGRRRIYGAGGVREAMFSLRLYTVPELRTMLFRAGFVAPEFLDERHEPLTTDSRRMLVRAYAGSCRG